MTSPVRLLAFPGSARRDSFNRKALRVLIAEAERAGATVTHVEPHDFSLPLYDGDLEEKQGLPENAKRLQQLFAEHDGLLLASPEYNGFFTPLLKNTFDWLSRPLPDGSGKPGSIHVRGKPAGLVAASPGNLGGMRSLQHTRQYLSNLGFLVAPEQAGIAGAGEAFDDNGQLKDDKLHKSIATVASSVVNLATRLRTKG